MKLLFYFFFLFLAPEVYSQCTPPVLSVSATTLSCNGMANGSATIYATGSGPFTYSWVPGGYTQSIVTSLSANNYSVFVTDLNNCQATAIVSIAAPTVFSLGAITNQTVCYGNSLAIFAQGMGGTVPYNYTITNINTSISTTSNNVPSGAIFNNTFTSTTTYTMFATDYNGCQSGPVTSIVNVHPKLLAAGMSTIVCDSANVFLASNIISPGNGGPYTFNWSNGAFTNTTTFTAIAANSPYTLTLSVSDGCTIPSALAYYTVTANYCTSIGETSNSSKGISVYPQPASSIITIAGIEENIRIKIFTLLGEDVTSYVFRTSEIININRLNAGIYNISFFNRDVLIASRRLVIAR